jgi:NADH-quinone oxidoreductase subunit L
MPVADYLTPSFKWAHHATEGHVGGLSAPTMGVVSLVVALLGIALALPYFRSGAFARGWRPNWWVRAADARFGYDAVVHFLVVGVGTAFADLTSALIDQQLIDGSVNGVAKLVGWGAKQMRQIQTGFVRNYALVILTGAVFVVACLIWLLPRPH